jgi:hypothetical protein
MLRVTSLSRRWLLLENWLKDGAIDFLGNVPGFSAHLCLSHPRKDHPDNATYL